MAMTVQQIIDSGQVDENVDTATLHEALSMLNFQIHGLQVAQWGATGQAWIVQHQALQAQIQSILNKRHGLDGMTPLKS